MSSKRISGTVVAWGGGEGGRGGVLLFVFVECSKNTCAGGLFIKH